MEKTERSNQRFLSSMKDGKEVPDANNDDLLLLFPAMPKSLAWAMATQVRMKQTNVLMVLWQRSAFNGKCQVIIQAGKTAGTIKLEAKANGLHF